MLLKSSLYHTRLDCFDDPYEGSVTLPYAEKRASGEIESYMPVPEFEPLNNLRLKLSNYASCWHANDEESPNMWKLYSNEHRGVAIVSSVKRLQASADVSEYKYGILGPVEYFDYLNDDMSLPMGLIARPGFSKRKAFSSEREIRGMVEIENHPDNPNDIFSETYTQQLTHSLPTGIDVPVDLDKLILEVVISPSAEGWFIDLVTSIVQRLDLKFPINKSGFLNQPMY